MEFKIIVNENGTYELYQDGKLRLHECSKNGIYDILKDVEDNS